MGSEVKGNKNTKYTAYFQYFNLGIFANTKISTIII